MHRAIIRAGVILGDPDDQTRHREADEAADEERLAGIGNAGQRAEADELIRHSGNADQREHRGRKHALIQRTHDRLAGAELDEEGADDRGDDADAADGERERHHPHQRVGAGAAEEDRGQDHGCDRGHGVGLEQIRGHAGAVADIVADIVGDRCRIAWIVFRNSGLDLADEVAADVGALGEDAAAKPREDRDQRGAEAERHHGIDHLAVVRRQVQRADEEAEIERDAQERETGNQKAGNGASAERDLKTGGKRTDRGLRGAHIGAHRDIHADEACRAGKNGADGEADGNQPAEEIADHQEDHDADNGDGAVLAFQIGLRAFAHGRGNLLHPLTAGIGPHDRARRPNGVDDGQSAANNNEPQRFHRKPPADWRAGSSRPDRMALRIHGARGQRKSARTLPNMPAPRNAPLARLWADSGRPEIADRPSRRDGFGRGDDGIGVDAVVPVELRDRAGLAEMLDAERPDAMAGDRAQPAERRRMTVEHADNAAMPRQAGEQPLDMGAGMDQAALARPPCRGPAGIEPVGGGDREQPDVAAIFRHQPDRLDRFGRDRAGIGHHDLTIRARLAQPIGAVDDRLTQRRRHVALDLLDRARRQPQIDRAAGLVAQPVAFGSPRRSPSR